MNLTLKDNSTIVVAGGGPAGSFFAHFALGLAKKRGQKINIIILGGRNYFQKAAIGCNRCLAVLSENLVEKMELAGVALPETRVGQKINGYYFQTKERGVALHHPEPARKPEIVTVLRGNGTHCSELTDNAGYDDFLLRYAASQGGTVISAAVEEIELPENPQDRVNIVYVESGVRKKIAADLVVGAFGLDTALIKRIIGKDFGYREPPSVRSCNAALCLGHSYIQERFRNTIHVFAPGIKPIASGVFIPNGNYVTVSLIGKEDITKTHLLAFLNHPRVRDLLPRGWTLPEDICICFPRMPVNHAERPYTNRLVIIGDAGMSGVYRSGIESAFDTARLAASAAFEHGISSEDFRKGYYNPALKLLAQAYFYGNLISRIHNYTTSGMQLVNVQFDHLEKRRNDWSALQINGILWDIVTGNTCYKDIFMRMINPRLHVAMLPYVLAALVKQGYCFVESYLHPKREQGLRVHKKPALGPLENGQTVVIVGGGPAGASCAIALKNIARKRNVNLDVVLYELKDFEGGVEHNECAGVLSPPIVHIIEEKLGVPFPWHLVKREVPGYHLHTGGCTIKLDGEGEVSYALRRVQFDAYLLQKARESGATIIRSKVKDVEINDDMVTVYSGTKHTRADVVVGAFGLEDGTQNTFERETPYKPPRFLLTILTKFHPQGRHHNLEGSDGYIHAFLPSLKGIEFGAITPKDDHYTINIAGEKISARSMDEFLRLPEVLAVLPKNFKDSLDSLDYHRGCFPVKPAKNLCGDRYVTIGDAAGLIRPFKGKGINAACLMGIKAAEVMMDTGISKKAFQTYLNCFQEVIQDLPYANAVRKSVVWGANYGFLTPVIRMANTHAALKKALFDSVSGKRSYRDIILGTTSVSLLLKVSAAITSWFVGRFWKRHNG